MNKIASHGKFSAIALLTFSGWVLFGLFCAALFVVISALSWFLPAIMPVGLAVLVVLVLVGVLFSVLMCASLAIERELLPLLNTRNIWMKYFVPVARSISKRIGLDPDKTVRTYITYSNLFVMSSLHAKPVTKIIILLPHCLQLQSCGMKLTSDVHNCKKCGKCVVNTLIELSDELNVGIFVASGGTMARQQIASTRPDLILAVACERDLLSGIRDTLPLQVVGILNERPQGPCVNTTVDSWKIAEIINTVKKAG